MTDREEDSFSQIIHNGYGPQIVGPNYGDIKYEIDPNMLAMLTGVSEDAAKLVGIVKQALSDGFMSEYSVTAFNRTAQHISDDLVDRLGWATRNLSEDNVDRLGWATRNLTNMSEDNVDRLGWATRNITEEIYAVGVLRVGRYDDESGGCHADGRHSAPSRYREAARELVRW